MTVQVTALWRYPIKGIGAEPLRAVTVQPDRPLPGDRAWAVHHAAAPEATHGWRPCREFLRGASGPHLMQVMAETRNDGTITLRHPDMAPLTIDPAKVPQSLLDWVVPLWPENRPAPARVVPAPAAGMSDVPFPSVSILNMASLHTLSQKLGQDLDPRRFRGNIWLEGLAPWGEFDLVGHEITVGSARLKIEKRITRCRATETSPETGLRDAATLKMLDQEWGHHDFGVYARITQPGEIRAGDMAKVV
ncbi:MOSC domain-containing protein [Lutimaribacter sp. EGI FJ00015]|uniref:MOSC domain-containing protein n=1 Tax=Lutimaribacter degradans TaxID=2945989 RepID=A0ACC5ZY16_9RHOB|nr:MOSC domain-containing protein [Lutimaribacter sp. EGI FJ00013]MCM2563231.1 MOSC domain-containing protein [Lutimaribacter sp. EGI FJ00013]MCO0614446.1 MOSC domain-containing protein [Lutimaribacter sp. EGI FJ00015]MCO0635953.1 MOSC domain-containing protein [Lutimaribacter sp. EGI FJ00014]